jgi:benzoate-CoA ligase
MGNGAALPSRFNFARHLLEANALRSGKTAYVDDTAALTYGALADGTRRVAAALAGAGVRREERVLVCLHDTVDFPQVFLGALHAGVVPVCANTLLTADDYAYMLEH